MQTVYINKSGEASLDLELVLEKCPFVSHCQTAKYAENYSQTQKCYDGSYNQCSTYQYGFNTRPISEFKR